MLIDFNTMQEKIVEHQRGGEKFVKTRGYADDSIRIVRSTLVPGASVGLHPHAGSVEVIYVLEGNGRVECDGEVERIGANMAHYCKDGSTHTFINDSDADIVYFAVIPQVG